MFCASGRHHDLLSIQARGTGAASAAVAVVLDECDDLARLSTAEGRGKARNVAVTVFSSLANQGAKFFVWPPTPSSVFCVPLAHAACGADSDLIGARSRAWSVVCSVASRLLLSYRWLRNVASGLVGG